VSAGLRDIFKRGVIKDNPAFVLVLGLCPTLAVTTSVANGIAMACAAAAVLVASNVIISLLRKVIPAGVRIPCYILVIASFVTMVELLMQAFLPEEINAQLGIFIPLIVVNCIILGRAEAFASKNGVLASAVDGLGMGLGFLVALVLISSVREVLGNGTFLGYQVAPGFFRPLSILILPPGAFLVLGLLMGYFNWVAARNKKPSPRSA